MWWFVVLCACIAPGATDDADGDGAGTKIDCDDDDPHVRPGARERCNGVDDDCDGLPDGADPDLEGTSWYRDADADGAGDPSGDGVPDLLVGAPLATTLHTGGAWLVDGTASGTTSLADAVELHGETTGDLAGAAVDGGQDVDGDGVPDLLVGAPAVGGDGAFVTSGIVWLFDGSDR